MKLKIKRKKILRLIKKESLLLPPETYYAIEKYYKPKWNDEEKEWKVGLIVSYPVNHYRRMKNYYDKFGLAAVNAYIIVKNEKKIKQDAEKINS